MGVFIAQRFSTTLLYVLPAEREEAASADKTYVLGVPQDAAATWAKIGAVTTLVNAVVAVVVASAFYLALRPALEHAGLLKKAV